METKKITWLYLEPHIAENSQIIMLMRDNNIQLNLFQYIGDIMSFIIKNKNNLKDYGLILELILPGTQFISLPEAWTGLPSKHVKASQYDAGLTFYEEFVMNERDGQGMRPFWKIPPPVIFLTSLIADQKTYERVENIKHHWLINHDLESEKARVDYIRKTETSKLLTKLI